MMNILNQATQAISHFSSSEAAGAIAVILGVTLRTIPSQQPMCVFLFLEELFAGIGAFCGSLSGALNKIIPQNVKLPK